MRDGLAPQPQGNYIPATRYGNLIFTAGMTPRRNGVLVAEGPVRCDVPIETYKNSVILCCSNAIAAARAMLNPGEHISASLSLTVYIAAEPGFAQHSRLADYASVHLREQLGPSGVGARAAIGVATLPSNAPVEILLIAAASSDP